MSFQTKKEKIQEVKVSYSLTDNYWYFLKTLLLLYYYLLLLYYYFIITFAGWRHLRSYNSKEICQISVEFGQLKD